ncbi:MAG TPA: glutaredoxin family protein [Candidatus Desulfobacillus sp.]|nr:glutaredoxin family protein [Candidatus Desulfobacillus sp.]
MATSRRARLTVYVRRDCHLCEDLLADLRPICEEQGADIELVDVDTDAGYRQAYGERVPVVAGDEAELCHYYLDAAAVRAYLLNFR